MSGYGELEAFSVYNDIWKWRVASRPGMAPSQATFKAANNKKLADLTGVVPGFAKYAALAGGLSEFQKLALEGKEYKWLEAFAAVEANRIRALPGLTVPQVRPTDVGYGDVFDAHKRPFDVKTVAPFGAFDIEGTLEERLFDKGGYTGLDSKSYPAVLILDVAFVSNIATFNAELKKIFSQSAKSGHKGHSWRVIEICVDYEDAGYATYEQKPHKEPATA